MKAALTPQLQIGELLNYQIEMMAFFNNGMILSLDGTVFNSNEQKYLAQALSEWLKSALEMTSQRNEFIDSSGSCIAGKEHMLDQIYLAARPIHLNCKKSFRMLTSLHKKRKAQLKSINEIRQIFKPLNDKFLKGRLR